MSRLASTPAFGVVENAKLRLPWCALIGQNGSSRRRLAAPVTAASARRLESGGSARVPSVRCSGECCVEEGGKRLTGCRARRGVYDEWRVVELWRGREGPEH